MPKFEVVVVTEAFYIVEADDKYKAMDIAESGKLEADLQKQRSNAWLIPPEDEDGKGS